MSSDFLHFAVSRNIMYSGKLCLPNVCSHISLLPVVRVASIEAILNYGNRRVISLSLFSFHVMISKQVNIQWFYRAHRHAVLLPIEALVARAPSWSPVTSGTRFCIHVVRLSIANCAPSNSTGLIHGWSGFDYVMPSLSRCSGSCNASALWRSRFNFCQTQFTWITSTSLHLKKYI